MQHEPIAIIGSTRTPIGEFMGQFQTLSAPLLGAAAISGAVTQSGIDPDTITEVIMGCVLSAGIGQAPARQAARFAGLPDHVEATTINKMCGSGMKSIMMGMDRLLSGSADVIVAGGLENMSLAPYLLPKARGGYRMGHQTVQDHMFLDGLEDAYDKGQLMGHFAELCAEHYDFSREDQDEFAIHSLTKAQQAVQNNYFANELTAVQVPSRKETKTIIQDELPLKAKLEKIPTLRPAFRSDGTITAANASALSDGAAAVVLMRQSDAQKKGLPIKALIHAQASFAQEPKWFTTAPVGAIKKVLEKTNWTLDQIGCFEINEAFAVVTMAAIQSLSLNPDKVNLFGGACALGHPVGASGARIVNTLLSTLAHANESHGIASLCIGGGEGVALAIERIQA